MPLSILVGQPELQISCRVQGAGTRDLVLVPDGLLPVAALSRHPAYAAFLDELATLGRLILFDRRGIGGSAATPGALGLARWADDTSAVLDALSTKPATLVGLAEGAMTAVACAAQYPGKVAALVLINATPGPSLVPLARRGMGPGYVDWLRSRLVRGWPASLPGVEFLAPSLARDRSFSIWLSGAFHEAGDPRQFLAAFDVALNSDVRHHLRKVRAPTLVIHRRSDAWFSAEHGRALANGISEARYLELPGDDHAPYAGDTAAIVRAIRWFLDETIPPHGIGTAVGQLTGLPLSSRQKEALRLAATGLSDKEIAARLELSVRTVQKHLEHAYRRLGVRNRTAASLALPAARRLH